MHDFRVERIGRGFPLGLIGALWILVLFGAPIFWKKVAGGAEVSWVGYQIQLLSRSLGTSAAGADLLIRWVMSLVAD